MKGIMNGKICGKGHSKATIGMIICEPLWDLARLLLLPVGAGLTACTAIAALVVESEQSQHARAIAEDPSLAQITTVWGMSDGVAMVLLIVGLPLLGAIGAVVTRIVHTFLRENTSALTHDSTRAHLTIVRKTETCDREFQRSDHDEP